ncbi:MAG TPA: mechanosensitive ion channel family protein [Thermomicrobiales bacterium]|nr:mechanosensitive ion channel family protein [Thermomicrobiales bacterium]
MPEISIDYDALREDLWDLARIGFWIAVWLIGGWWLGSLARAWVRSTLSRRSMGWNGTVLLSRLASIAIRIIAVLLVLNTLGVSGTGLLAVVSAFTVAIGLSLQDVLKNFFAGIYLLLERPFRSGDRIVVKDVSGEVQGIDIRTTLVKNRDNELVLIPNATIFTEILRNDSFYGVRRMEFTIKSETRTVHEIEERMHGALGSVDGVKRPLPAPRIVSKAGETLTMTTSLVVENTDEAENAASQALIDALPGDTIEVNLT